MFVAGLAKAFLSGESETFLVVAAPAIGAAVTYFGRAANAFILDPRDDARRSFAYWRARRTLKNMQNRQGISATRRKEIGRDIDDLDRMFASHVKNRMSAQIGDSDRDE